jgi:transposase-like protein
MARRSRFSQEVRERAVRLVFDHKSDHGSGQAHSLRAPSSQMGSVQGVGSHAERPHEVVRPDLVRLTRR